MSAPAAAPAASKSAVEPPPAPPPTLAARPAAPDKPSRRGRFTSVPARMRATAVAVVLLMAALAVALTVGVGKARTDVREVGRSTAPQSATAADLYFALADIDAQVANILLIGHDEQIGNKQSALRQLRRQRAAVNADLQELVDRGLGGADSAVAAELIAGLSRYDALAAQAQLADDQVPDRPVGRPPALAVNFYLSATALMHQDLLPAADRLGRDAEARLASVADDGRDTTRIAAGTAAWFGFGAVVLLVVWQVRLARRFRRVLNPGLVVVTVAVGALTVLGATLIADQGTRVYDAKTRSFDPFTDLARARAVAADANADASRNLILADRQAYYQGEFSTKSAALTTPSRAPELSARLAAFRRDAQAFQDAVAAGRREAAVGMATNVGRGNLAFEFFDYQDTLALAAADHRAAFDEDMAAAEDALTGWTWLPFAVLVPAAGLLAVSIRPRLREYA